MLRNVYEGLQTWRGEHELSLGEELFGKSVEQRLFEIFAREAERAEVIGWEVSRYAV